MPNQILLGDGRCVFDIVMKESAPSETVSGKEIARAAWKLVNECVRDQNNQGGVISGIGTFQVESSRFAETSQILGTFWTDYHLY